MRKAAIRPTVLAATATAAASCCITLGSWGASASAAAVPPPKSPISTASGATTSAASAPRCYAARGDPSRVVCYRTSWKAEYRGGDIVYVPRLIQVPTPSPPPSAVIVDSLNDIRPEAGQGSGS
ncbi:hypothetical protein ACIOD1_20670 [Streptomyces sp. NPDC088097]|uniref:hypothetical protein n=1 Tax=Streptomyces sp. NPDC088097 TaxID=3365823 RepID=UPI00380FD5C1